MILDRSKKPVLINLPPELVMKARNHGLNISKVCENALKDIIQRIEGVNTANSSDSWVKPSSKEGLMGQSGFEPESRAPEARSLDQTSRQPHVC